MFFPIFVLIVGLAISSTAGYFSVVGLAQLFAANFWSVIIMGSVIEIGKVTAATWLHKHWKDKLVSKLHKAYLLIAILLAMFVTSLGIFTQLSKAHLDQKAPIIEQLTSQDNIQNQVIFLQKNLDSLQKNLDQINSISNTDNNNSLDRQRNQVLREMTKIRSQINDLNSQLLTDKKQTSQVTLQMGPAKYLADLIFGNPTDQNMDKAIQIFIIIIMIVFDPLAIMLILSANISFDQYFNKKIPVKINEQKPEESVIEKIQETIQPIVEEKTEIPVESGSIAEAIKEEKQPTPKFLSWASFASKPKK